MHIDHKLGPFLSRITLRAAKLPSIYFLAGITLVALSYIDDIFPLTAWKHQFDTTDKVGNIFLALGMATFIYNFIVLCCRWYEKKLSTNHKVQALVVTTLRKGLRVIFLLVAINIILTISGPTKFSLVLANNIIDTIIIVSIGWLAIQILYTLEAALYHRMSQLSNADHLRMKAFYTKMHIIRNIATVVIVIMTIAAVLMSFSSVRNIGISLLASAGFLTAIIGLSAQKTLFSLFSGLQLALSQAIKIGDIVVVDGTSGIIEEITFTYVTLKLGDRRRLVVPINYFIDKPFENWSREGDSLRSSLHFYLDYMTPIEPIREELAKILAASAFWDKKACKLQVSDLTERAVQLRIQVSAANADDLSDLRAEVREKILEYIRTQFPDHFPKVRVNEKPLLSIA